jgi:tetratricopeptide (TPR) repeat protein
MPVDAPWPAPALQPGRLTVVQSAGGRVGPLPAGVRALRVDAGALRGGLALLRRTEELLRDELAHDVFAHAPWPGLRAGLRRRLLGEEPVAPRGPRVVAGLEQLAVAEGRPVVWVIERAHQADADTRGWLGRQVRHVRDWSVAVVVGVAPDDPWGAGLAAHAEHCFGASAVIRESASARVVHEHPPDGQRAVREDEDGAQVGPAAMALLRAAASMGRSFSLAELALLVDVPEHRAAFLVQEAQEGGWELEDAGAGVLRFGRGAAELLRQGVSRAVGEVWERRLGELRGEHDGEGEVGLGGMGRGGPGLGDSEHEGTEHDGTIHEGASRGGTSHEGTVRGGTSREGTSRGGTSREGTSREGTSREGTSREATDHVGMGHAGTGHAGTGHGGTEHEGTSRGGTGHAGTSREGTGRGGTSREATGRGGTDHEGAGHAGTGHAGALRHEGTGHGDTDHDHADLEDGGLEGAGHAGTGHAGALGHAGTGPGDTDHDHADLEDGGHEGAGRAGTGHEGALGHEGTGHGDTDHDGADLEDLGHVGTSRGGMDHEGTDHEGTDHEGTRARAATHEATSREATSREATSREATSRAGTDHDLTDLADAGHAGTGHTGALGHEGTGHGDTDHDGAGHEGLGHEGTSREATSREATSHEATSREGTGHAGTDHAGTEHAGTGHVGTEHAGTEHAGTGHAGTDHGDTSHVGRDHTGRHSENTHHQTILGNRNPPSSATTRAARALLARAAEARSHGAWNEAAALLSTLEQRLPAEELRGGAVGRALRLERTRLAWEATGSGIDLDTALRWAEELIQDAAAAGDEEHAREARVLAAGIAHDIGDPAALDRALDHLQHATRALQAAGRPREAAALLNDQAAVWVRIGDPVRAAHLLEASRQVFAASQGVDDQAELAETLLLLSRLVLHVEARPGKERAAQEQALDHARQARTLFQAAGDPRHAALAQATEGRLLLLLGRTDAALQTLAGALEAQRALHDVLGLARTADALARVMLAQGRPDRAAQFLADSLRFNAAAGARRGLAYNRELAGRIRAEVDEDSELAGVLEGWVDQLG